MGLDRGLRCATCARDTQRWTEHWTERGSGDNPNPMLGFLTWRLLTVTTLRCVRDQQNSISELGRTSAGGYRVPRHSETLAM